MVGRLAVRRAGRVALLTCGAAVPRLLAPQRRPPARSSGCAGARGGRRRRTAAPPAAERSPTGLRRVALLARGPGLVVVVSDFREGDPRAERPPWARALGALAARHDVLAVEVVDPREGELPDVGQLVLVDPETGRARWRPTRPAPSCGGASRPPSWRGATRWRARCGARARGT